MKMKKFYLSFMPFLMALVLCVGFASCSSDDDDGSGTGSGSGSGSSVNTKELVGTWEFSTGIETVMGQTITIDRSMLAQLESQMEQLSGKNVEFWDVTLTISEDKINGVPYKLNGKQIVMDGMEADGMSCKMTIKSLTDTKLVLHEEIVIEELTITADMTYERK